MTVTAYRGYLIKLHPIHDTWLISRDGVHISYATSFEHARQIVDELT